MDPNGVSDQNVNVEGSSAPQIAPTHDINANRAFAWRKLDREGLLKIREATRAPGTLKGTEAAERLRI